MILPNRFEGVRAWFCGASIFYWYSDRTDGRGRRLLAAAVISRFPDWFPINSDEWPVMT